MSRLLWMLGEIKSQLWVRASLYGLVAVVTALAAIYVKRFIPEDVSQKIGAEAVDSILNIMAASMLSVTIFSLSTMVSAYSAASNGVTPRATKLLIEDKISHGALSTFIGAFIFSIVGIVALKTGAYGDSGRLVLFIVTVGVIVMVIITLLRWIEYLARLGRVNETIRRVEDVTTKALKERLRFPYLGGYPLDEHVQIPSHAVPVMADEIGYIQHIDMAHLAHIADEHKLTVYIQASPGKFVDDHTVIMEVAATDTEINADMIQDLRQAFVIEQERSFRQDPRYGMAVLCEIGTRALSAAVNDTGTPIYVLGVGVRVLSLWAKRQELMESDHDVLYPRIYVPPLRIDDLCDDFFTALARDSAAILEVQIRLQKAYAALLRTGDADLQRVITVYAERSLRRSLSALALEDDKELLQKVYAENFKNATIS